MSLYTEQLVKRVFEKLDGDWNKTALSPDRMFITKKEAYLRGKKNMYDKLRLLFWEEGIIIQTKENREE